MALPDILGQQVDEAQPLPDRTLVEGIGREEPVEVPRPQVGHHVRRRDHANLDVSIRIQPMLGDVVAQKEVVHRVFEGHAEGHALPLLRVALVHVLVRQHDRLAVDVLDRRHDEGLRGRARAHRHRQRHGRQHVAGVVFPRQRLVAGNGPTGGLDHLDVEAIARIEAHRLGHDDRGCAGYGDEADVQVCLLRRAERFQHGRFGLVQRQDRRKGRRHRPAADHPHEGPPRHVAMAEDRADERAFDRALDHRLGGGGNGRGRFGRAALAPASRAVPEVGLGGKWISQCLDRHPEPLLLFFGQRMRQSAGVCEQWV